jgi:hypothetical protein
MAISGRQVTGDERSGLLAWAIGGYWNYAEPRSLVRLRGE